MGYHVSRQIQWPDGDKVVEIAIGGLDHAGPDMLVAKNSGEGETYLDPREAVKIALDIKQEWEHDIDEPVRIDYGHADLVTLTDDCDAMTLKLWADKEYLSLDHCERCGEIVDKHGECYTLPDEIGEGFCCSQYCMEDMIEDYQAEQYNEAIKTARELITSSGNFDILVKNIEEANDMLEQGYGVSWDSEIDNYDVPVFGPNPDYYTGDLPGVVSWDYEHILVWDGYRFEVLDRVFKQVETTADVYGDKISL